MDYIRIVDLDEMNNLVIQSFFIWGHLVSHLSKFDQVKFGQISVSLWTLNDFWMLQ